MRAPPVETLEEMAVRQVMDLHGLVSLAQRVQQNIIDNRQVLAGEGMEEDLMEEAPLDSSGESLSDGEEGRREDSPQVPGFFD